MKESFWRDLYGQTVAQTAHHQRDRALLRGSATENPTYGVLCERRKCGPHHLLHLPEIQSGMENPHPQPIYTSCLTSPITCRLLILPLQRNIRVRKTESVHEQLSPKQLVP